MRGIPHTSRMDRARDEVRASDARTKARKGQLLDPIAELNAVLSGDPDCAFATLVDDDPRDPKTWADAMQTKNR
jgi:hypothetical protein